MLTPFIKLALYLVGGILLGLLVSIPPKLLWLPISSCFVVFCLTYLRARKLFITDAFFGFSTFLLVFLIGLLTSNLHKPEYQSDHYLHLLNSGEQQQAVVVRISEILKPDRYNLRYIVRVEFLNGRATKGKLLLLIPGDTQDPVVLQADNRLLISGEIQELRTALNPHQFDYRKFMANRKVHRQIRIQSGTYIQLKDAPTSIRGSAARFRNKVIQKLQTQDLEQEELGVIQALLLGERNDLQQETYENYAAAGIVHILAISGLHVGIILMILHRLLTPLRRLRHGPQMAFVVLLLCLWGYALLAGLSPSVVRAVTMFSFVGIGMQLNRPTHTLNSLFVSFFLLLLIQPGNLLEVGFQLSYLAVLFIVLLQPYFAKIWSPQSKVLKYFRDLLSVSLAAQIGVLPLCLYYFHQLPGLFLLSNLLVLPFLGAILFTGFLIILLALLDVLPELLSTWYGSAIGLMNQLAAWIARQEAFLFEEIPFSLLKVLCMYLLFYAGIRLLQQPQPKRLFFLLNSILVLQAAYYYERYSLPQNEIVIFQQSLQSLIGERNAQRFILYEDTALAAIPNAVKPYLREAGVKVVHHQGIADLYALPKGYLLVVDSLGVYNIPGLAPEFVLLRQSPDIHLERLIQTLKPKQVIADASNYHSYVARWKTTCRKLRVDFHYTAENGAWTSN